MELRVSTDLTTAIPSVISFNFEELKAELSEMLDRYNHLVITEDSIRSGKADRAKLNKLKQAIDTRRREIKAACMAPVTAFEAQIKELTSLIDEPIASIDRQLSVYEQMRREEKRQKVADSYATIVPETLREIIPLETIFNSKWENATTTMKQIEEEIADRVKRTTADLLVLDTIEPEYALSAKDTYIRTLDIQCAIAKRDALKKAQEAFKQATQAEAPTAPQIAPVSHYEPQGQETAAQTVDAPAESETVYRLCLELHVTKAQANALKAFLATNNISYTKI